MTSEKQALMDRAKAKKKEFEAQLLKLKADTTSESNEKKRSLEDKLKKFEADIKEGSDNFTDEVARKINKWLQ